MCGSRYQLDLVEEVAISQLNIAFRIARRVVKFLDLLLLAVPQSYRPPDGQGVAPSAPFNDRSTKHASFHGLKERLAFFHDEWKADHE